MFFQRIFFSNCLRYNANNSFNTISPVHIDAIIPKGFAGSAELQTFLKIDVMDHWIALRFLGKAAYKNITGNKKK